MVAKESGHFLLDYVSGTGGMIDAASIGVNFQYTPLPG